MRRPLPLVLLMVMLLVGMSAARAQQAETPVDEDGSSQQTEQSDESFRRSRELEDARARDRTYVDNTYTAQTELEKIDKLPEESRDNIRDQLVDIIVEDGEWEPSDVLKEYPYEATAAAESDPELKEQEQEAWDEQIEKYHEREAAAWGSHSGPVPGPGNPSGQEGGQAGEEGGEGGSGGGQGEGGGSGSPGTYQPGSNGSEDEVSTAGVSESALDFLKGRQQSSTQPGGQPQSSPQQAQDQQAQDQQAQDQQAQDQQAQDQQAQEQQPDQESSEQQQAAQESSEEQSEQQQERVEDVNLDTRGIIAIKDLDKLEGAAAPEDDPENDQ